MDDYWTPDGAKSRKERSSRKLRDVPKYSILKLLPVSGIVCCVQPPLCTSRRQTGLPARALRMGKKEDWRTT